jgi:hypothetical protein
MMGEHDLLLAETYVRMLREEDGLYYLSRHMEQFPLLEMEKGLIRFMLNIYSSQQLGIITPDARYVFAGQEWPVFILDENQEPEKNRLRRRYYSHESNMRQPHNQEPTQISTGDKLLPLQIDPVRGAAGCEGSGERPAVEP